MGRTISEAGSPDQVRRRLACDESAVERVRLPKLRGGVETGSEGKAEEDETLTLCRSASSMLSPSAVLELTGAKDFADLVTTIESPQDLNSIVGAEKGQVAERVRDALWEATKAQKATETLMENGTQDTPDTVTNR